MSDLDISALEVVATPQLSAAEEARIMLDVHAPHESIHGWRDFLLHIATITIGLFIALSLEAGVEGLHHRHIVRESREQIREEVKQNQQILAMDRKILAVIRPKLHEDLVILAHMKDHSASADKSKFNLRDYGWAGTLDTAFATARDSGALALMPYDYAHAYTGIYKQQDFVNQYALRYLDHFRAAGIPLTINSDIAALTPAQLDQVTQNIATTLSDIEFLEALMDGLDRNYAGLLQQL